VIYTDLKIKDDDIALDSDGRVEYVHDRDCIIQDLIHAIRESGYLVAMVAERSPEKRKLLLQKITLLVEDDERIVPGTVTITDNAPSPGMNDWSWDLLAETYEFGNVELKIEN